ncbi:CCN family member 3-like [Polyodon spathula]|uniref:CCN family member 3-like n=1 Tax=Polyodon spathula TaxID=7913 RepID=UPI001B7F6087|nr:CCN family member 3-like [Polyodon spathula]
MIRLQARIVQLFFFFVSMLFWSPVSAQPCPSQCKCPTEPPICAPGVQLMLDDCACCLVCGRQQGEACSERNPCDTRKALRCDYSADPRKTVGVCMAREGDICVFDGSVYQNGETFQPSCKYQCACRDGQIGCVPRCNLDVLLPGPDCPIPRKVQVPGECCEKWVCDSKAESPLGGFAMAAYRQEDTYGVDIFDPSINCIEQTTEWGACSKSCGMGVSTRVTNRNRRCEMGKQNRLCIVRPCEKEHQKQTSKKGKKCFRTKKTVKPTHFEFKNCTSVHAYKPRYCGVCSDGRCCTPHSTKTVQVEFQCPRGKTIKKTMMFINTCACHNNCPRDNAVFQMSDPMFSGFKI